MVYFDILDISRFINQDDDPLLLENEAEEIREQVGSEEYINIAKKVVEEICALGGVSHLGNREIFYISRRASIIDAINQQSTNISRIINEHGEGVKEIAPISVVMALALNEIIIHYINAGNIKHIHNSPQSNAYRTKVSIDGKEVYRSDSYIKQSKANALRNALKKRRTLVEEQKQAKINTKRKLQLEKARIGLIETGILIPTKEGGDQYKISYIRLRDAKKSSATVLVFRKEISGEKHSIRRSISEHGFRSAFDDILCKLLEVIPLNGIEKTVLQGEEFKKQVLYNS